MFDVVELFVTFSETGYPYFEFEVSPYNQNFQVRIVAHAQHQEGVDLGLVSTATIRPASGWDAELKIPLKPLGWDGDPKKIRGNFYSILGTGSTRSYWSTFLPKAKTCRLSSAAVFSNSASMRIDRGNEMKRRDFLKVTGGCRRMQLSVVRCCQFGGPRPKPACRSRRCRRCSIPKTIWCWFPQTKTSAEYNRSFNKRTQIAPRVRVVAGSAKAVGTTMLWAANNGLRLRGPLGRAFL